MWHCNLCVNETPNFSTLPQHSIRGILTPTHHLPRITCAPLALLSCRCRLPTRSPPPPHMASSFQARTTLGSEALSQRSHVNLYTIRPPSRARSRPHPRHYSRSRPSSAQADSDHQQTHVPCLVKTAHSYRLPLRAQPGWVTSVSGTSL